MTRRMPDERERLALAVSAFRDPRTPSRIYVVLRDHGLAGLQSHLDGLPSADRERVEEEAYRLAAADVRVMMYGDAEYPAGLGPDAGAPILFYWGNPEILAKPAVGMCGSRSATDLGIRAARACGQEIVERGLVIVSGYAKGVDTETHLTALRGGGNTVVVLAEGFFHYRRKAIFPPELFRSDNVLLISQFPPTQPWSPGAAMTRNRVICGLGMCLVVIEAGERGGTLAAGESALRAAKPVFVLDFNGSTPAGNRILLQKGARGVANRYELGEQVDRILKNPAGHERQLRLL